MGFMNMFALTHLRIMSAFLFRFVFQAFQALFCAAHEKIAEPKSSVHFSFGEEGIRVIYLRDEPTTSLV